MSLLVLFAGLVEIIVEVYSTGKTLLLKLFPKAETSLKILGVVCTTAFNKFKLHFQLFCDFTVNAIIFLQLNLKKQKFGFAIFQQYASLD